MSDLVKALKFINKWVDKHMPDHPAMMSEGLTSRVIEEKVKKLPFQLSIEIKELYQWRNGGKKPFIPHPDGWDIASFFSLEEAIKAANDWDETEHLFPLFGIEDCGYFVICTQEKNEKSPVYCSDVPEDAIKQNPRYSSVTSMMQELVEELKNRSIK
jgi:hypothetical protein